MLVCVRVRCECVSVCACRGRSPAPNEVGLLCVKHRPGWCVSVCGPTTTVCPPTDDRACRTTPRRTCRGQEVHRLHPVARSELRRQQADTPQPGTKDGRLSSPPILVWEGGGRRRVSHRARVGTRDAGRVGGGLVMITSDARDAHTLRVGWSPTVALTRVTREGGPSCRYVVREW